MTDETHPPHSETDLDEAIKRAAMMAGPAIILANTDASGRVRSYDTLVEGRIVLRTTPDGKVIDA